MKFILLMLLSITYFPLWAASYKARPEVIQSYLVSTKEPNLAKLSEQFEVVEKNDNILTFYVLKDQAKKFKQLAPKAQLLSRDVNHALKSDKFLSDGYHDIVSAYKQIKAWPQRYPKLATLASYGTTEDKNALYALTLSSEKARQLGNAPKLLITAATHGDELITVEVMFVLIEKLLDQYGKDARLSAMLDSAEITFIPVVNPDGYSTRSRYSHRQDPNRQYPWPENPDRKDISACIKHLMAFYGQKKFQGSLDLHAFGKMVMYPWAYTEELVAAADRDMFAELTKNMASGNQYKHGPISHVIYTAKGSSADYYYWKHQGQAIAVELTTSKYPYPERIPHVIAEAEPMIWTFIEHFTR